jgi:hypothetical protein
MAVASAPLAFGLLDSVVILVVAVVLFVVVVAVTAVLMGLLQAVLPSGDSGADALHRQELDEAVDAAGEPVAGPDAGPQGHLH